MEDQLGVHDSEQAQGASKVTQNQTGLMDISPHPDKERQPNIEDIMKSASDEIGPGRVVAGINLDQLRLTAHQKNISFSEDGGVAIRIINKSGTEDETTDIYNVGVSGLLTRIRLDKPDYTGFSYIASLEYDDKRRLVGKRNEIINNNSSIHDETVIYEYPDHQLDDQYRSYSLSGKTGEKTCVSSPASRQRDIVKKQIQELESNAKSGLSIEDMERINASQSELYDLLNKANEKEWSDLDSKISIHGYIEHVRILGRALAKGYHFTTILFSLNNLINTPNVPQEIKKAGINVLTQASDKMIEMSHFYTKARDQYGVNALLSALKVMSEKDLFTADSVLEKGRVLRAIKGDMIELLNPTGEDYEPSFEVSMEFIDAAIYIFKYFPRQESQGLLTAIRSVVDKELDKEKLDADFVSSEFVYALCDTYDLDLNRMGRQIIEKYLEEYGIANYKVWLEVWKKNLGDAQWRNRQKNYGKNIRTISLIETFHPGITKALHEKFGIYNFGRYSERMLKAQYERMDDESRKYGVVFYPLSDDDGAFFEDASILDCMGSQLNPDETNPEYNVRIVEVNDKIDLVKSMNQLQRLYPSHKISFGILGGHGTKSSVLLGSYKIDRPHPAPHSHDRYEIQAKDLEDPRAQMGEVFEENAKLILFSCEVGFDGEGGFARKIRDVLHLNVIASDEITSPKEMTATKQPNAPPIFKVEYHKGKTNIYSREKDS